MKYGKCGKCGAIAKGDYLGMCPASMPARFSGICGGSLNEISKKEYNKIMKQFKQEQL